MLKKLVETYRISEWAYYVGFVLIGMACQRTYAVYLPLLATAMLAYAYSLNDFYDLKKKSIIFIYPLILGFLIFPLLTFVQILISLLFLFIVTTYSVKPFRFKNKKIISTFYNGMGFALLFILGFSVVEIFSIRLILLSLIFFLFNIVAQLIHEICHFESDKKSKTLNTTVVYGEKFSINLSIILLAMCILISVTLLYLNLISILFFLTSVAFSSYFAVKFFTTKVDKSFRNMYKKLGVLAGFLFLISVLL